MYYTSRKVGSSAMYECETMNFIQSFTNYNRFHNARLKFFAFSRISYVLWGKFVCESRTMKNLITQWLTNEKRTNITAPLRNDFFLWAVYTNVSRGRRSFVAFVARCRGSSKRASILICASESIVDNAIACAHVQCRFVSRWLHSMAKAAGPFKSHSLWISTVCWD